jgi:kynureninase
MSGWTRAALEALDSADPLARFRDMFQLREGLVYLDGNSLGALPRRTSARLAQTVTEEWGEGLITSWLGADWMAAPRRVGDKIARLLGASPGEVIACDSTSINLFKAMTAALSLRPDRSVILSEAGNFPTDLYMMQGIAAFSGGRVRALAVPGEAVEDRLGKDIAVLLLTQVHYKTGAVRDMAEVTRRAHAAGALVVWDLSHSAGAIPVDLNGADADFAVGCGYKFLNGGPGAPAYIFAAQRHQTAAVPVLSGWFGHAAPFAFEDGYRPADGIERFLCGTPPVLGLTALECGVDLMAEADMAAVRAKSLQLGRVFMDLMDSHCGSFGFTLVSPREDGRRGSHVSYAHPRGYGIMQALKERGVIGDFRDPDVLRFGLTPLTLRHVDMLEAVLRIREVCETQAWDDPRWAVRAAVT